MRTPKELNKYVVYTKWTDENVLRERFQYFDTIKTAKAWAKLQYGVSRLYKISYTDKGPV